MTPPYNTNRLMRAIFITIGIILLWQLLISLYHLPPYILPSPFVVIKTAVQQYTLIGQHAIITIIETLLGLLLGSLFGIICAITFIYFQPAKSWFFPLLIISQALPTFAIAPLLVLWLGYGLSSKIAVTMLMLFFPVTSSFYDGLASTPQAYLDMAQIAEATTWSKLWYIQIPKALPALASGLRVAATFAPMGAIIGEWVGASQGLGFLMLNANARVQISLLFAVLLVVVLLTLLLYFSVDLILKKLIWWH